MQEPEFGPFHFFLPDKNMVNIILGWENINNENIGQIKLWLAYGRDIVFLVSYFPEKSILKRYLVDVSIKLFHSHSM